MTTVQGIYADAHGHMQIIVSDIQHYTLICNNNEEYALTFMDANTFCLKNNKNDIGTYDTDNQLIQWVGDEKTWTKLHISPNQMFTLKRRSYIPMTVVATAVFIYVVTKFVAFVTTISKRFKAFGEATVYKRIVEC